MMKPNNKKKKNSSGGSTTALVAYLPKPRLPRSLGSPNLSVTGTLYPRVDLDMPIALVNTGVVAGSMAVVDNIDSTLIPNFSTRFGSTFKEFAIVGVVYEVRINQAANSSGSILAYIDEDTAGAPTASSLNYPHAVIPIVNTAVDSTGSVHKIKWTNKNYLDLEWLSVTSVAAVGYLKLFAGAVTGTIAGTTATVLVSGSVAVCFRGYI